ncbi:PREDICTED: TLC domain-containing protein At5g14285 [Tarenaya hassleriana]|uniref:TLC domain-containing protein At5g14285 n=1 Tax=Tarenaya hassleriana TaxID=28532 RepID=UPI00053C5247|nr:PREDICTED: TLC domain-containing protein At5g14285 [Tarenaya hassleriana]
METSSFHSPAALPSSFIFFSAVHLVGYFMIFRTWKPTHRSGATSCVVSLFHGTPAVLMASHALLTNPRATASSANTAEEAAVLDFSMGYFAVDLLHYLLFLPHDAVLFILHHMATLYVFATCRFFVGRGGHALLLLLVLAESTSACQNVWSLAGYRKTDVVLARKVREMLSPAFYVSYTVVRGLVGPVVLYDMAAFYGRGAADGWVPRWAWLSWLVVIGAAIFASLLWVWGNWSIWFRERKLQNSTKKKGGS